MGPATSCREAKSKEPNRETEDDDNEEVHDVDHQEDRDTETEGYHDVEHHDKEAKYRCLKNRRPLH